MRVRVIAECGSCHDGQLPLAYELIETAHQCGADIAKFQYWSSAERMAKRRHADAYKEIYQQYQVPRGWLAMLRKKCDQIGIQFACSVYLPEDVWAVAEQSDIVKVASFEANDEPLLTACRVPLAAGKRVIVSLGMGADAEMVRNHLHHGFPVNDELPPVTLMHCVSAYPAPIDQLRLRRINDWRSGWMVNGYSDHSPHDEDWAGAVAVARGAQVVERHLKLWKTSTSNPDSPHAMDPAGFGRYVGNIRKAEQMLGPELENGPVPCEAEMAKYRVWGRD